MKKPRRKQRAKEQKEKNTGLLGERVAAACARRQDLLLKTRRARICLQILTLAERHGSLRSALEAIVAAVQKLAATDTARPRPGRAAEETRSALEAYLYSLLQSLDVETKAALIDAFVDDIWACGSSLGGKTHPTGTVVNGDNRAVSCILAAMRNVAAAYCHIAEEGNATLANELPIYATQLVECLNGVVQSYPELVRDYAMHSVTWPIMVAKNYPKESDFAKLAERIGLGAEYTVGAHKAQKWKPETPINKFLLHFFDGMIMTKKECYVLRENRKPPKLTPRTVRVWLDEIIMPGLDYIRENEGSWEGIKALANMLKKVPYEAEHRRHVRNRIKAALKAMARDVPC